MQTEVHFYNIISHFQNITSNCVIIKNGKSQIANEFICPHFIRQRNQWFLQVCSVFQLKWRSLVWWSRLTWHQRWLWDSAYPSLRTAWVMSSLAFWRNPLSGSSCASCILMATSSAACSRTARPSTRKVGEKKILCILSADWKVETFCPRWPHLDSVLPQSSVSDSGFQFQAKSWVGTSL